MPGVKHPVEIVVWEDGKFWLGHFVEFPDYTTQGITKADLYEQLADLWHELAVNPIPGVRRLETLAV
jgi:predicted RNase H-like HicB family nuclease